MAPIHHSLQSVGTTFDLQDEETDSAYAFSTLRSAPDHFLHIFDIPDDQSPAESRRHCEKSSNLQDEHSGQQRVSHSESQHDK